MNPAESRPPKATYQTEEVQEILQLALLRRSEGGELTRDQLLEMAVELDISPEALQAAERDWLLQAAEDRDRQEFERARWSTLKQQIGRFAIANSFLLLLDLAISHSLSWSLYIVLLWGMALSLKIWKTAQTQGDDYERAFESWQRQRQFKTASGRLFRRAAGLWVELLRTP